MIGEIMNDYDQLLEDFLSTPAEVDYEPEAETPVTNKLATFRAFPKLTVSKENNRQWGRKGTPPMAHKTIQFVREAPFVELLQKKLTVCANELPEVGNYTSALNMCFALGVDALYEYAQEKKKYTSEFRQGKEVPEEWVDIILQDEATYAKLQQKKFEEDLTNLWLPEFKRLGYEQFSQRYGQHSDYAQIIEHCQKAAPLTAMVSQSEEGYTLSSKIKIYLIEWSKDESLVAYKDIEQALVNESILPDPSDIDEFKKAKSVLKAIGSTLKLSGKAQRGYWDLSSLRES